MNTGQAPQTTTIESSEAKYQFSVLYIGDCPQRFGLVAEALAASRRLHFHVNRLSAREAALDALESRQDEAWLIDACDDAELAETLVKETDHRAACPARILLVCGGERRPAADATLDVEQLQTEAIERAVAEALRRRREQRAYLERQARAQLQPRQPAAQLTIDPQGLIESANAAAEQLLGFPANGLHGLPAKKVVPAIDVCGAVAPRRQESTGMAAHFGRDVWVSRSDGTAVPVHLVVSERVEADGQRRLVATARDLSEAKESERQLRESQRFLQATLNSLSARIAILDDRGVVIAVNDAWRAFAEGQPAWRPSAVVGANYLAACTLGMTEYGGEGPRVAHDIWQLLSARRGELSLEYSSCGATGRRWFAMRAARFPLDGPPCVVISHEDVTERKCLEAQLLQAQKLESIGQLAAGIAHEINTPTQYISDNARFMQDAFGGLGELLREVAGLGRLNEPDALSRACRRLPELAAQADLDYLLDEIPQAIEQSLEGIERVAGIVRAMKEFAHPDTPEKTPVDLNRSIQSTLTVARNEWKYVADVATDLQPDLPRVLCLPGEINQVVLNLAINAAHAIGESVAAGKLTRGQIRVSTRLEGDFVEIRVADDGAGIPPEIHGKIFDPFFSTKGVGKGTGQGLAISHAVIVKKHGGTITFESELGRGTTFLVRLPAPTTKEVEPATQREKAEAAA